MHFRMLTLALASLALLATPAPVAQNQTQVSATEKAAIDCNFGQCNAIARSTGQRCKHCVSNRGDLYCWQHKD